MRHFRRCGAECWLLVNEGEAPIRARIAFPGAARLGGYDLWAGRAFRLCEGDTAALELPRRGSLLVFACGADDWAALPPMPAAVLLPEADFRLTAEDPDAVQKIYEADYTVSDAQLAACSLPACLAPGAALGAAAALDVFAAQLALEGSAAGGTLWGVILGMALLAGFAPYLCAQLVLFEQPLGRSLKNSLLLFLAGLPRSLGAAAILLGYAAAIALFAPLAYLLLILGNVWLPLAAALLAVYRPMEQALDLEKQVRAVQEERRGRQ